MLAVSEHPALEWLLDAVEFVFALRQRYAVGRSHILGWD